MDRSDFALRKANPHDDRRDVDDAGQRDSGIGELADLSEFLDHDTRDRGRRSALVDRDVNRIELLVDDLALGPKALERGDGADTTLDEVLVAQDIAIVRRTLGLELSALRRCCLRIDA